MTITNIKSISEADKKLNSLDIEYDDRIKMDGYYLYFIGTPNEEQVATYSPETKELDIED